MSQVAWFFTLIGLFAGAAVAFRALMLDDDINDGTVITGMLVAAVLGASVIVCVLYGLWALAGVLAGTLTGCAA